ncbi:homoserine dehydrogenase [Brevundimonas sp.]|uniref:homoserine dehydrogenase n=1 Tax=Brevundimonas sp. TaxID=1871086 RepID=UPI002C79BEDC|nr:Gfo/Idh/MocA family oxidoreductase [Brevundimonas sp.]HWQ88289.1 Gfo/Idh/MocA family oxidoreductase [Brevundimonas sp.]
MTALPLARIPAADDVSAPVADEPVALLQLDLADPVEAASAVYRQVRRGRRVVAVACGRADASAILAEALDAIGVTAVRAAPGDALLHEGVTIVPGPGIAVVRPRPARSRRLRVALAGCGVVGGGVLPRLLADPRFEVVGVLVRDPGKARDVAIPQGLALSDPAALLAREPDVVVEAISDASTGLALIRAALSRGVDVVSANKQAIGGDLPGLTALAGSAGARLLYSASVGGGAPLIETVRRAALQGDIVRIEAVLNGTCNFILNRLAEGGAFDDALTAARDAGFAEEDPTADLTGLDAAAKLAILAHEGLGRSLRIEAVARQTLSADAVLPVGRVRQMARLDVASGQTGVAFETVDGDALFAALPDEANALRVTLADGRIFTATGRGAGRRPTAESVQADMEDLIETR